MSKTITLPYEEYKNLLTIFEEAKDNIVILEPDHKFHVFQDTYGFDNLDIPIPRVRCFGENDVVLEFQEKVKKLEANLISLRGEVRERNERIKSLEWSEKYSKNELINLTKKIEKVENELPKKWKRKFEYLFPVSNKYLKDLDG